MKPDEKVLALAVAVKHLVAVVRHFLPVAGCRWIYEQRKEQHWSDDAIIAEPIHAATAVDVILNPKNESFQDRQDRSKDKKPRFDWNAILGCEISYRPGIRLPLDLLGHRFDELLRQCRFTGICDGMFYAGRVSGILEYMDFELSSDLPRCPIPQETLADLESAALAIEQFVLQPAGREFFSPTITAPVWDSQTSTLRFKGQLIRNVRKQAIRQREVLDVFQTQGWPHRIPKSDFPSGDLSQTLKDMRKTARKYFCPVRFESEGDSVSWSVQYPSPDATASDDDSSDQYLSPDTTALDDDSSE